MLVTAALASDGYGSLAVRAELKEEFQPVAWGWPSVPVGSVLCNGIVGEAHLQSAI